MEYFSKLKPSGAVTIDTRALSDDGLIVLDQYGIGALGWSLEVADRLVDAIYAAMPTSRAETANSPIFLRGVRSSALRALRMAAGTSELPPITDEGADVARDFARRNIDVAHLMESHRIGVPVLAKAHIGAAIKELPPAEAVIEVERLSMLFFDWLEEFSKQMFAAYQEEAERWKLSQSADKLAVINSILADKALDSAPASRSLDYDFSGRHIAAVAWTKHVAPARAELLVDAVTHELRALGAEVVLAVPVGMSEAWGWGTVSAVRVPKDYTPPLDIFVASSQGHTGLDGFRLAHRQAKDVQHLHAHAAQKLPRAVRHADVELATVLCANVEGARRFAHRHLGELARKDDRFDIIRETLWLYLEHERSIATVAAAQFVARNTVTYRIKQAEVLMGTALHKNRLNIHVALFILRLIGDSA